MIAAALWNVQNWNLQTVAHSLFQPEPLKKS